MARLVFGYEPQELTVVLSWGGGWVQEFERVDTPFEDGDRVVMGFYVADEPNTTATAEWEATIDGQDGRWDVDPADVLAVLNAKAKFVRVHLIPSAAPTKPIVWAVGDYAKK